MSTEQSLLITAFCEALLDIDLSARVRDALHARPRGKGKPALLAVGKSAAPMLAGALEAYGPKGFSRVISARPWGSMGHAKKVRCEDFVCGHPLPDAKSVEAALAMVDAVQRLSAQDTVIVLLSGGASAAACLPVTVSLETARTMIEGFLSSGVDIKALNEARGRFDAFKLGGLARAAKPATVVTLASADILGDDASIWPTLGGAPTYEAGSEMQGAVLARPHDLRDAVVAKLSAQGLEVSVRDDATQSVETLAQRYAEGLDAMAPNTAWVAVGEPSVALPKARGRGGRAGRLALGVAKALAGRDGWSFVACASDGVDGSSGAAGAVVSGETWSKPGAEEAWKTYNDGEFMRSARASVSLPPTGLNLLDAHVMVRR